MRQGAWIWPVSFTGARIQSGVELVIQETQLEKYIARADYIFTGEGRLDEQSCFGKTPVGVARLARQYGKPVIACAGVLAHKLTLCIKRALLQFSEFWTRAAILSQLAKMEPLIWSVLAKISVVF